MSSRHRRPRRGAPGDEQGIDPSTYFEGPRHDARGERKVQQLCKEVERTLGYALGACDDERVRELIVVEVEPAPDGSRLRITLCPARAADRVAIEAIEGALLGARGLLRAEIAAVLQRKRTPELVFRVIPTPAAEEVEP